MKDIFSNYVNSFDMNNEDIVIKYEHSLRVMDLSEYISRNENFTEDEINLAKLIGLLHDYGRFEQLNKYNTYNDFKSIDHGDLGCFILFDENEIKKYTNDNLETIYNSIKYHNKYELPSLDDKTIKFCKLVRDADKIDILYIFINKIIALEEQDEEISEVVKNDFFNKKTIKLLDCKNKNDKIIVYLAFIFDINYDSSIKYIKENKMHEKLYEVIKNKEIFKPYFDFINEYINERIDKNVR